MDDAVKVMAEEEPELKEVQFLRVEAEERANISMEFQVAAVPTFLFFRSGKLLESISSTHFRKRQNFKEVHWQRIICLVIFCEIIFILSS